jgi:hypothetical protein
VLEAKDLITTGKVYQLGREYESDMPIAGKRHFSLTCDAPRSGRSFAELRL